jgi:hypothetical protein
MDARAEFKRVIRLHGVLVRRKNHFVYRVFGQLLVMPKSPSDVRAYQNGLARLRRMAKQQGVELERD